ncbi:hypothetical protein ID007_004334 [Salmonella enterica]|nr:hypothetical protein [Salmonella enterica]
MALTQIRIKLRVACDLSTESDDLTLFEPMSIKSGIAFAGQWLKRDGFTLVG